MDGIDPAEIEEGFRKHRRSIDFFEKNYGMLCKRYPDMYVVILNGKVDGSDKDLLALIRGYHKRGTDLSCAYIKRTYVKEKELPMILSFA